MPGTVHVPTNVMARAASTTPAEVMTVKESEVQRHVSRVESFNMADDSQIEDLDYDNDSESEF